MSDETPFTPTRLVLVRHGESQVTVRRVVGGPRSCTGLSELGRRQAERLRDRLTDTGELRDVAALYSSEYPRALETAEIIRSAFEPDVRRDARFGEHDPGPECDGLRFDEFVDRFGMPDWHGDPHGVTFPGGETLATFHHRVGEAIHAAVTEHAGATIVVSCHGGVVDAALRSLLRLAPVGAFDLHTANTSLTEFVQTRPRRWRLVRYNDAGHLAGLPAETPRE